MSAAEWRDSLARDYADAPDFEPWARLAGPLIHVPTPDEETQA